MQERSTLLKLEVFGNSDIAGIILSYGKDYCNFRLTCKYMYTAVDSMSFGLKLKQANSFKPNKISEFFYNHPLISTGAMAVCFGMLGGSNIILSPIVSTLSASLGCSYTTAFIGIFKGLNVALKRGETDMSHIVSRMFDGAKTSFISTWKSDISLVTCGFGVVWGVGLGCANGLGGVAGLMHDRCENIIEAGIVSLATGAAMVGFFANSKTVKHNQERRKEIRNEIHTEFLHEHKATYKK
jgi:hypothetical protein